MDPALRFQFALDLRRRVSRSQKLRKGDRPRLCRCDDLSCKNLAVSAVIPGTRPVSPRAQREVDMKILPSAIALLVGSNVAAIAAEQTLKFKLAYFFMEQKDGENHFMGVTIAWDGTLGTKDFFAKQGENGAFKGRSIYDFPKGRSILPWSVTAQVQTRAAISRASTNSFPAQAPIRARRSQVGSRATGAEPAPERRPPRR